MQARLLATILLIMTIIAMSGCAINTGTGPGPDSIWANVSETYNVVDNSGNNVSYSYPLTTVSGHFTYTNFLTSRGGGGGSTFNNGSTYSLESMWPVNPGDYIVFGASNNSSWLSEDLADKQFNPGKAGYWRMLTYDDINNSTGGDRNITINIIITVSEETGKMLKES
jgi:hypothetical protein